MSGDSSCSGRTRCHELAAVVTKVVLALAREHADKDMVSLADLERICALVCKGTISLDEAFRRHAETCRQEHSRPKGNVGARSNPFQRMMVRPFETLLVGEHAVFPRHYLPNYFEFLGRALGGELEKYETHCRSIIQALLVVHGNNLTWDHFYADQRTLKTMAAALAILERYLTSPEGTTAWHTCLVRPVGEHPAPSIPHTDQVRRAIQDTARGLAAG
ncbi:MAG: hypothetical protein EPN20_10745 [Magnetospirillum sp.]|nr:MAG: hypothetical protein EPN20_10745 [Magnetospirillum sp.]